MRVLLVEPNWKNAEHLRAPFINLGHTVDTAISVEEVRDYTSFYNYDVILVSTSKMYPDIDFRLLELRRSRVLRTPVMIIDDPTERQPIRNEINYLGRGASGYILKPYDENLLLARVKAVALLSNGHVSSTIVIGDLTVDLDNRSCKMGDTSITLTGNQFKIMEILALRKGNRVAKEAIMNHIYGGPEQPELKIIDVMIHRIRSSLRSGQKNKGDVYIRTVWGAGFVLDTPEKNRYDLEVGKVAPLEVKFNAQVDPNAAGSSPTPARKVGRPKKTTDASACEFA